MSMSMILQVKKCRYTCRRIIKSLIWTRLAVFWVHMLFVWLMPQIAYKPRIRQKVEGLDSHFQCMLTTDLLSPPFFVRFLKIREILIALQPISANQPLGWFTQPQLNNRMTCLYGLVCILNMMGCICVTPFLVG